MKDVIPDSVTVWASVLHVFQRGANGFELAGILKMNYASLRRKTLYRSLLRRSCRLSYGFEKD